ncbi:MAG TPA: hypothetical protein VEB21_08800 [Terriglobales bacterium]|nr:hypothetical protein [Terriglobales bacterium]
MKPARLAVLIAVPSLLVLVPSAPSYATVNACLAAKEACVGKLSAALLKCYAKDSKPNGGDPIKINTCLSKAVVAFSGGEQPEKGCFAKAEAKHGSTCFTTGDSDAIEQTTRAFVGQLICELDPCNPICPDSACNPAPCTNCEPQTCVEIRDRLIAANDPLEDGEYTLYFDGDESRPWTAYCSGMRFDAQNVKEYLPVDPQRNFSEVSDGTNVTRTSFHRLRINLGTQTIDLLDGSFATTVLAPGGAGGPLAPPAGRQHIPVGWAEFISPTASGGAAHASVDLRGTSFAMSPSVSVSYFRSVTDGVTAAPSATEVYLPDDSYGRVQLSASTTVTNSNVRVVADGAHLATPAEDFTTATLPVQYTGG